MNRHTMGNDWGGRRKVNPENAPKITCKMVEDYAKSVGIEIKRDGIRGMWFYHGFRKNENNWYTLGSTNYIALKYLKLLNYTEN